MEQDSVKIALDVTRDLEVKVHNGHMLGTLLINRDGFAYRKPNRRRTTPANRLSWEAIDALAQADPAELESVLSLLGHQPQPAPAPQPPPPPPAPETKSYPPTGVTVQKHHNPDKVWVVVLDRRQEHEIWQGLCKACRDYGGYWRQQTSRRHNRDWQLAGFAFNNPVDAGTFASDLRAGKVPA